MSFIGIISNKKSFENIRKEILEEINEDTINLIQINLRSIENVKNIKFKIIIIEDNINKFNNNKETLEKICKNSEYLIINIDKNPEYKQITDNQNIVTYGLNHNAIITISSISDTDILIYLQKNIEKNKIEIEERRIQRKEKNKCKTYEILIIYAILKLYNKNIIKEI